MITKDLEDKKEQWLRECENSWEDYMVKLENKWMHPDLGFENEYKCKLFPHCGKWPGKKWLLWFKKQGLTCLKKDYQKWLKTRLQEYNKMMKKTLLQYNTKYQEEWCSTSGKKKEDDYWNKWYTWRLYGDAEYPLKSRKYCLWLGRTTSEKNEWKKFLQECGKTYMGEKCPSLQDFLTEKSDFFKSWLFDFFKKWVECRQWKTWIQERKDLIAQKKGKKAN